MSRSKSGPILRAALIPGAVLACVWSGCAPYGLSMDRVLGRLARGDPQSALAQLDKNPREQDALYQLERGILLRLTGRRPESNKAFDVAQGIAEDLYTRSVGREAAALAVSDRLRPYRPPMHELLLARQYQARNYLDEADLEGAAVEARRIGLLSAEVAAGIVDRPAEGDLLARLTAALILEAAAEPDNALIIYRNLLREASDPKGSLRLPLPDWLAPRAGRLAEDLGVDLSGEISPKNAIGEPAGKPAFTVVVFVEAGFVPPRKEARISVPILKAEEGKDRGWVGGVVGQRALLLSHDGWFPPEPAGIAYWLEIALPGYGFDSYAPFSCEVSAAGRRAAGSPAADIASCARTTLEGEMPGIALRAALRALIKYSAHHEAEEKGGAALGILVNVLGAATESAETRSWLSLPHQIDLAVIDLPAPVEEVELAIREASGRERTIRLPLVRPPGCTFGFGSYRAWD